MLLLVVIDNYSEGHVNLQCTSRWLVKSLYCRKELPRNTLLTYTKTGIVVFSLIDVICVRH